MEIFVGNLVFTAADSDLEEIFSAYGDVTSAKIINDRDTQRSRGFGFVSMPNDDEARNAIDGLNDSDFSGRNITVNEARPREPRRNRY